MYANLNPRTMGMNHHSYEELLAAAHKNGFRGIEVPAHAFGSVERAKEEGKRLTNLGMKWGLMMAPCDMYKVCDEEFEQAVEQWARWLERARAAGCTRAYNHFWPGADDRCFEENFEWHHKRLKKIFHIMKENGIQYGLEFMGAQTVRDQFRYPFIRNLSGTMALADSVSHEIGFVFDGIHWYTSGAKEEDLYLCLQNMGRIVNLHLDDAYPGRTAAEQYDRERAMPNESGVIDSTRIVRLFRKYGYEGPVIVEPMSPTTDRYEKMDLNEAVREAALCLEHIFKEAGVFI
ncbi:MAG: sugar phosphate isomerase/epimerase [Clostridiales bacterium]|nr:sugar phosphate isomerase/epimerase [Clostridiales bacterium]